MFTVDSIWYQIRNTCPLYVIFSLWLRPGMMVDPVRPAPAHFRSKCNISHFVFQLARPFLLCRECHSVACRLYMLQRALHAAGINQRAAPALSHTISAIIKDTVSTMKFSTAYSVLICVLLMCSGEQATGHAVCQLWICTHSTSKLTVSAATRRLACHCSSPCACKQSAALGTGGPAGLRATRLPGAPVCCDRLPWLHLGGNPHGVWHRDHEQPQQLCDPLGPSGGAGEQGKGTSAAALLRFCPCVARHDCVPARPVGVEQVPHIHSMPPSCTSNSRAQARQRGSVGQLDALCTPQRAPDS
jgi:hypothetical protein